MALSHNVTELYSQTTFIHTTERQRDRGEGERERGKEGVKGRERDRERIGVLLEYKNWT